jgi:hypothetical protein
MAQLDPARFNQPPKKPEGKVPIRHREALARAAGALVAQMDPTKPKDALRRLLGFFDGDIKTTITTHRKRYILLPDEQPKANHLWGANWAEYWAVAEAALDVLAQGKHGDAKERYMSQELRRFERIGLGMRVPTLAGSHASILEGWAEQVARRISEDTDIQNLWQTLRQMPFKPSDLTEWNSVFATVRAAREAERELDVATTGFRPLTASELHADFNGQFGRGSFANPRYLAFHGLRWAAPRISLGWVAYTDEFRVFVLPERFRGYESELQDHIGEMRWNAVPEFLPWLESVGGSELHFPSTRYSDDLDYGWYNNKYYVVCEVELAVEPDETGIPVLHIYQEFDPDAVPVALVKASGDDEADEVEIELVERILSSDDVNFSDFLIKLPYALTLVECEESLQKLGVADARLCFKEGLIDILADHSDYETKPQWAEDIAAPLVSGQDSARDALLYDGGRQYRFYPSFPFDDQLANAAPAGSVAAAIIANTHQGPPDATIAGQLLAQANKIATAGLGYANQVREFHLQAIRQI